MKDLEDRVALITGGARGIGAASARALAEAGAKVVVSDVSDGSAVAKEVGGAFVKHDVTSEAEWQAAVAFAKKTFGGLDILVNNAGVFWQKPLAATSLEDFRRMQQVNVDGVFLGLKTAIPVIAERSKSWEGGGSIVNLSSIAGLVGASLTLAYAASKGAVRLMTKAAAMECAQAGLKIRVNSVHPGVIDTPMMAKAASDIMARTGENEDAAKARMAQRHPLGRLGRDTDVANAIRFLASDAAGFMTGSELVVDGGMTAN
ncbi:MAG TPA: glucose 1-dehydrogenase [Hyphomonadaceae bacterium]|nr:glucose 1-dehydrogenase [Hyphomonadaceae bacterium]